LGKGSRFTVLLPARESAAIELREPERQEIAGGKGEWILVVDDETAMQHIAKLTLTAAGYQVLTAKNGCIALELYKERPHDIPLVLTDLVMPVMDGAALVQALQDVNPAVRVVVTSGLLAGAETAESLGPAVKSFLPKPYTMDTLLSIVRAALDGK
jgi:DNA-binding NtrC family response regulator